MNPDNFDLNLIRVFLAVARHGNVTEASRELHLTQSSVSHALARLRTVCKDPLFVRSSGGMVPTAAALAMVEPLEQALQSIRHSVQGALPFDHALSDRRFRLLLTDIGQLSYLPPLLEHLRAHAPRVAIEVLPLAMDAYQSAFVQGDADLAIGYLPTPYSGFHRRKLFTARQVCMLRADHPDIRDAITREQYLQATHIVVEPPGRGPGVVERALGAARLQRNVAVRLPNIFAGPLIVRRTDHVMTVPEHTRFLQDELAGLAFLPLPPELEVEAMDIELLWHERMHHDPGNQWLRGVIVELFSGTPRGDRTVVSAPERQAPPPRDRRA